jgi:hypothetical protein
MNTTKIIFLAIMFNLILVITSIGLDTNKSETDVITAFEDIFAPFQTINEDKMTPIQKGGTNTNGGEVDPWGWIKVPLSSVAGTANNLMEGIINIAIFAEVFFLTVAKAMINTISGGFLSNPDGYFVITIMNGILALVAFVINFTLIREVYNILINRKWSD